MVVVGVVVVVVKVVVVVVVVVVEVVLVVVVAVAIGKISENIYKHQITHMGHFRTMSGHVL